MLFLTAPTEFTSVPFPVKAIKILLHELQSGGESATMGNTQDYVDGVDTDDEVGNVLPRLVLIDDRPLTGQRLVGYGR